MRELLNCLQFRFCNALPATAKNPKKPSPSAEGVAQATDEVQ